MNMCPRDGSGLRCGKRYERIATALPRVIEPSFGAIDPFGHAIFRFVAGREEASATTALIVKSGVPHDGRTDDASCRSFSPNARAWSSEVSGRINASDHAVYFTATSVWRIADESARASCSM